MSTFDLGDPLDLQELHRHIMRPWEGKETIFAEKTLPLFLAAASVAEATGGHMLRILAQRSSGSEVLLDLAAGRSEDRLVFRASAPPEAVRVGDLE